MDVRADAGVTFDSAAVVTAPSPLAGEGYSVVQRKRMGEGLQPTPHPSEFVERSGLPSPARGEGAIISASVATIAEGPACLLSGRGQSAASAMDQRVFLYTAVRGFLLVSRSKPPASARTTMTAAPVM